MMESVSSRKYYFAGKEQGRNHRFKGFGHFTTFLYFMARQFQSFSFYDNFVTIANRQFLNPISAGSTDKYFFLIQDTVLPNVRIRYSSFHSGLGREGILME